MIRFDLLGAVALRGADGAPVDALLRQPKRLALLAYLVMPAPGTWHRRDTLVALFWPELDTAHARTSLRNALYTIRQALGDDVLRTRGDEEIAVDAALVETDHASLAAALRDGRGDAALAVYGGELLPGLFASDSDGFQRWLDGERARIKREVARLGLAWAAALEREGRLPEALAAARRVVEIHGEDETAVRQLMRIHDAMGDRAGGLAAYERYKNRLAEEFGAAPAAETIALAKALRVMAQPSVAGVSAGITAAAPSSAAAAAPPSRRPLALGVSALIALGIAALTLAPLARSLASRPPAIGATAPLTSEEGLQVDPSISPSGRLVAYGRGTGRRMRVLIQKIAGGEPWALTGDSTAFEQFPRWSPDNDELLFLARDGAYVKAMSGGTTRLVAAGAPGDADVRSASWSPNGDSVVIVRHDSLLVQPLDRPGARFVGTGFQLHSCVWGGRDRWIACVSGNWIAHVPGPLFGNRGPSAIVLFPATGGGARYLTDKEKEYDSPAWSGDGRFLWVVSDRGGQPNDVYAIPVGGDGRAAGELVRIGLSAGSVSLSNDRAAYSVPMRRANVWSVPIPEHPPVTLAAARQVTDGNQVIEVPSISRDGKWLVYDSDLRGNPDIYRVAVGGGAVMRETDDVHEEFGGALSPDDRELAYQMWVDGKRHLFVKDLATALVRPVIGEQRDWGVPRWSPDGTALAAWSHENEAGAVTVVRRDAQGRWMRPEWTLENAQLPVWSPDGKRIAFVQLAGSIGIIAADSGPAEIAYAPRTGSGDPLVTFLAWWKDPAQLWFLGHVPRGHSGIWRLPLSGGRPVLLVDLGDPADRANGPALATDGSRFYFTLDERSANVRWAELVKR